MAPIVGTAHVAYIPNERVVGLSKLARVVEVFSKKITNSRKINNASSQSFNDFIRCKRGCGYD